MNAIRPWLEIGKYRETLDGDLLAQRGVGAMLLLTEAVEHPGIESLFLPVEDGEPLPVQLLREGVAFVLNWKEHGKRVLIACGAGISRSSTFAIAALKEAEGLTVLEATQSVGANHPEALPHPALWESLCTHYGEKTTFWEMLRALAEARKSPHARPATRI